MSPVSWNIGQPEAFLSDCRCVPSPDLGVSDVQGVLQPVLPGQPTTQPLNHAVAQDLQVAPPASIWSQTTTSSSSAAAAAAAAAPPCSAKLCHVVMDQWYGSVKGHVQLSAMFPTVKRGDGYRPDSCFTTV